MKNPRVSKIFTMNKAIMIFLCLSMIYPIEATDNQLELFPQSSINGREVSPRLSSTAGQVPLEDTILPLTNLTVTQYIFGSGQVNTFSTSVLSLNSSHWLTHSDYANTSTISSPFNSIIGRESVNHTYPTSGYWNWGEEEDKPFDFWIDPTGFSIDYSYPVRIEGALYDTTVIGLKNITMSGVGNFEVWNITIDNFLYPNFAYYEKNTGIMLCTYLRIVGNIWYNITLAELAILPGGYLGPMLDEYSPSNLTILASGSIISASFHSPYDIQYLRYNWDDETDTLLTSSDFQTSIPSVGGSHNLTIIVTDMIGYSSSYFLLYITDNTLPGIVLNDPQNNSKIQGSTELNFTIVSGNGTFTYNWNYSAVNVSFIMNGDNALINVSFPEVESVRILQVYIKSNNTEDWISSTYRFYVDNSPPDIIIYDFVNNSVLKGEVRIPFSSSEDVYVSYSLNQDLDNSFFVEAGENSTLMFNSLENGTYDLEITLEDEAGNSLTITLRFSIYSSYFNWNWDIEAEKAQTFNFVDETGSRWFSFVVVSESAQSFNISLLSPSDAPYLSTDFQFGINLLCEIPEDIIYVSFTYHLPESLVDNNQSFPIMKWIVWEEQKQEWSEVETLYNQVLHAWETTYTGYNQFFALVNTGESTQLKSVEVGGGGIPSFELPIAIASMIIIYSLRSRKNKKIGEKHVYETN